ncbi:hypothetical protein SV7mr_32420 [Stieleria bergensis]|uniref:Uncharacterized protein n=1 Tax=Stieleria bergensis TaxID=2528025 RepID=A0A517SX46_9BACT|nr:hypothetical protein SV7mr_32420 [Planctomycetes bacterium SV_7m_r]
MEVSRELLKLERWSPGGQNLPSGNLSIYVGCNRRGDHLNEVNLIESLGQVPASETVRVFRDFLRGHVREMSCEVWPLKSLSFVASSMLRPRGATIEQARAQVAFSTKVNAKT